MNQNMDILNERYNAKIEPYNNQSAELKLAAI